MSFLYFCDFFKDRTEHFPDFIQTYLQIHDIIVVNAVSTICLFRVLVQIVATDSEKTSDFRKIINLYTNQITIYGQLSDETAHVIDTELFHATLNQLILLLTDSDKYGSVFLLDFIQFLFPVPYEAFLVFYDALVPAFSLLAYYVLVLSIRC